MTQEPVPPQCRAAAGNEAPLPPTGPPTVGGSDTHSDLKKKKDTDLIFPSTAVIEGDVGAVLEGNVLQILSNDTGSFEFVYDKHFSEKHILLELMTFTNRKPKKRGSLTN